MCGSPAVCRQAPILEQPFPTVERAYPVAHTHGGAPVPGATGADKLAIGVAARELTALRNHAGWISTMGPHHPIGNPILGRIYGLVP